MYRQCLLMQSVLCKFASLNARSRSAPLSAIDSLINQSAFHTSSLWRKRRKTAEERKSPRIIEYSPKAKGEIVDVWRDITAKELAQLLGKDLNYVRDIFLNEFRHPETVINDVKALQNALKRGGMRMRLVARPQNVLEKLEEADAVRRPPASPQDLRPRPPVVTVMGHVDHGKTTLLDALRKARVVEQEFGGITQHIGAFSVQLQNGGLITFLDTPGHAAFRSMRERGAHVTDIVVLVVAADDGVMEQTVESIRMAKEAKVPILVAINKIDAPHADVERTKRSLVEAGIQVESFGGDVQAVPISALKRTNLEQLTEALCLQAELLELAADPTGLVEAVVVESRLDPHRGRMCTLVIQRGTLHKGAILVAGTSFCRVKTIKNDAGRPLSELKPGLPGEIDGWRDLPTPGELVLEVDSERRARSVVRTREEKKMLEKQDRDAEAIALKEAQHQQEYKERLALKRRMGRFRLRREGPRKPEIPREDEEELSRRLNLIIKADVDGTLEAILDTLDSYDEDDECRLDLVHYGVGSPTETDLELAQTFNSLIYTFNVETSEKLRQLAEKSGIPIKDHNIIYKLVDDVKGEINARLKPTEAEDVLGEAVVLQQFEVSEGRRKVAVAGCRCVDGALKRAAIYRLVREGQVVYDGALSSMRHLKNEVDVIKKDLECGLQLADKSVVFEEGDRIICYQKRLEPRTTKWDPGF